MTFETWLAFVPIWVAACVGIGPNSVVCANAGASNGFLRGLWAALGITAASLTHSLIAAFGFSAVLLLYAEAYAILKWLGVAYLVYLGLRLWCRRPAALEIGGAAMERRGVLFRRAFFCSMTNPQSILTYLAIFAPAIDPARALAPQLAVLIPTAVGVVFLMFTGYVLSGTPLRFVVTSLRRQRLFNRVSAGFFLGSAALLASADSRR